MDYVSLRPSTNVQKQVLTIWIFVIFGSFLDNVDQGFIIIENFLFSLLLIQHTSGQV